MRECVSDLSNGRAALYKCRLDRKYSKPKKSARPESLLSASTTDWSGASLLIVSGTARPRPGLGLQLRHIDQLDVIMGAFSSLFFTRSAAVVNEIDGGGTDNSIPRLGER